MCKSDYNLYDYIAMWQMMQKNNHWLGHGCSSLSLSATCQIDWPKFSAFIINHLFVLKSQLFSAVKTIKKEGCRASCKRIHRRSRVRSVEVAASEKSKKKKCDNQNGKSNKRNNMQEFRRKPKRLSDYSFLCDCKSLDTETNEMCLIATISTEWSTRIYLYTIYFTNLS